MQCPLCKHKLYEHVCLHSLTSGQLVWCTKTYAIGVTRTPSTSSNRVQMSDTSTWTGHSFPKKHFELLRRITATACYIITLTVMSRYLIVSASLQDILGTSTPKDSVPPLAMSWDPLQEWQAGGALGHLPPVLSGPQRRDQQNLRPWNLTAAPQGFTMCSVGDG